MRTKILKPVVFAVLLICCLLLAACGSAASTAASSPAVAEVVPSMPPPAYDSAAPQTDEAYTGTEQNTGLTLPQDNRMVIITANMHIEALEFNKTCDALQKAALDLGGYVSSSDMQGSSENALQSATFTIKVPAQNYTQFMALAQGSGNMVYRNEQSEDVTDQYIDVNSRLKTLRTEETWLLEQLEKASTLTNMIDLRDRLSSVQYEIESYTAHQRNLEQQSTYSTVTITVEEVAIYTEPPTETYGQQIQKTSGNAWQATLGVFKTMLLFIVAVHPFLIFCAIVLVIVLIIVKRIKKKHAKQRAENPMPIYGGTPPYVQPQNTQGPPNSTNNMQ